MSPWHWAILALVVVVLFGAKRLPESARSVGKSIRIFRTEVTELPTPEVHSAPPPPFCTSESKPADDLKSRGPLR